MGFIFTDILENYSKAPQDASRRPSVFFLYLLVPGASSWCPLLTMKCLAEERRLGTIETLLTTPVTTTEVVLGKYARRLPPLPGRSGARPAGSSTS